MANTEKDHLESLKRRIRARKQHEDNKTRAVQMQERIVEEMEK